MAPKAKPKAGAVGSAANVPGRRSEVGAGGSASAGSLPAVKAGAKAKAGAKGKARGFLFPVTAKVRSPEDLAVMVWQGAGRCFKAQELLMTLLAEKQKADAEMEKAMRDAHAAAMAVDRKHEEAKREKEAAKRKLAKQIADDTKKILAAAFDGEEKDVLALLDKGLSVNAHDTLGTTIISEAATGGFASVVTLMLEKKADPNSQGEFKRTPLWRAAYASHLEALNLLLEGGADPRIIDEQGQMPLDVASKDDVLEALRAWDVEKTDELVEDYNSWFEGSRLEEELRQKQVMQSVDSEYEVAREKHEAAQMMLAKAKSQMRNREKEYGIELAAKEQKAIDACMSADEEVQRAEAEAAVAQGRFDKANVARMKVAEDHAIVGVLPGREVTITALNNVLVRDLGNRTRDGDQWILVIDPNDCAKKLLFYSGSAVLGFFKADEMDPERLRIALLTMIRAGGTLAIDLACFGTGVNKALLAEPFERVHKGLFEEICSRSIVQKAKGSHYQDFYKMITKEEKVDKFRLELFDDERIASFKFVILTSTEHPNKELVDSFDIVRVIAAAE